ncbi:hypothetical protein BX666DRAFT_1895293 [Dichotomocladium elegans]|nr:hypothetical protein BX666DRAFT_1895293 [Dichotomocladium elegans]
MSFMKSLQAIWFAGHGATLYFTIVYFVSMAIMHPNTFSYKGAYLSACISYGIIVFKTYADRKTTSRHYAHRYATDENVQYLILALFWLFLNPVLVTLIPYATYAAFHTFSYLRTTVISDTLIQQKIKTWTNANYNAAMRFVAIIEVVAITFVLALQLYSLQILPLLGHMVFLRYRYLSSPFTRAAFHDVDVNLIPRVPRALKRTYESLRGVLIRLGTQQEDCQ